MRFRSNNLSSLFIILFNFLNYFHSINSFYNHNQQRSFNAYQNDYPHFKNTFPNRSYQRRHMVNNPPLARPPNQPIPQPHLPPPQNPSLARPQDRSYNPANQPVHQPHLPPVRNQPLARPPNQHVNQPHVPSIPKPHLPPAHNKPLERPPNQPVNQPVARPPNQPLARPPNQPVVRPPNVNKPHVPSIPKPHLPPAHNKPLERPPNQPINQPVARPPNAHVNPANQAIPQPHVPSVQNRPSDHNKPLERPPNQPVARPSNQPIYPSVPRPTVPPVQNQPHLPPDYNKPLERPPNQPPNRPLARPPDHNEPLARPPNQPIPQPHLPPPQNPSLARPQDRPYNPANQPVPQPTFKPALPPIQNPSDSPFIQPTFPPIKYIPTSRPIQYKPTMSTVNMPPKLDESISSITKPPFVQNPQIVNKMTPLVPVDKSRQNMVNNSEVEQPSNIFRPKYPSSVNDNKFLSDFDMYKRLLNDNLLLTSQTNRMLKDFITGNAHILMNRPIFYNPLIKLNQTQAKLSDLIRAFLLINQLQKNSYKPSKLNENDRNLLNKLKEDLNLNDNQFVNDGSFNELEKDRKLLDDDLSYNNSISYLETINENALKEMGLDKNELIYRLKNKKLSLNDLKNHLDSLDQVKLKKLGVDKCRLSKCLGAEKGNEYNSANKINDPNKNLNDYKGENLNNKFENELINRLKEDQNLMNKVTNKKFDLNDLEEYVKNMQPGELKKLGIDKNNLLNRLKSDKDFLNKLKDKNFIHSDNLKNFGVSDKGNLSNDFNDNRMHLDKLEDYINNVHPDKLKDLNLNKNDLLNRLQYIKNLHDFYSDQIKLNYPKIGQYAGKDGLKMYLTKISEENLRKIGINKQKLLDNLDSNNINLDSLENHFKSIDPVLLNKLGINKNDIIYHIEVSKNNFDNRFKNLGNPNTFDIDQLNNFQPNFNNKQGRPQFDYNGSFNSPARFNSNQFYPPNSPNRLNPNQFNQPNRFNPLNKSPSNSFDKTKMLDDCRNLVNILLKNKCDHLKNLMNNDKDKLNIGINIFNNPKKGPNKLSGNKQNKLNKNTNYGLRPESNTKIDKEYYEKDDNDDEDENNGDEDSEFEYDDDDEDQDEFEYEDDYDENYEDEDEDEYGDEDEDENKSNLDKPNKVVPNKSQNKYLGKPLAKGNSNLAHKTGNAFNRPPSNRPSNFNKINNSKNPNLIDVKNPQTDLDNRIKNNLIKFPMTNIDDNRKNDLFFNFKNSKNANLEKILSQSPYLLINLPFLNKTTKLVNQGKHLETKNKIAANFLANDVLVTLLINYKILFKKLDHNSLPTL